MLIYGPYHRCVTKPLRALMLFINVVHMMWINAYVMKFSNPDMGCLLIITRFYYCAAKLISPQQ